MNSELPRRSIPELVALYELEPTLRDVVTEGETDKAFIRWFLDSVHGNANEVSVYSVDELDVPAHIVAAHGLAIGNRSELIALCLEIEKRMGRDSRNLTGIIDSDADCLFGATCNCSLVLRSDFSCLEMYLLDERCLGKMLKLSFPKVQISPAQVIAQLAPILRDLFLTRAANQKLALGAKWIDFGSFVDVQRCKLSLRLAEFHRSFLQNSGLWHRRTDLGRVIDVLRTLLPGDPRHESNGHDALCLLGYFLRGVYKKAKDADRTHPHVLVHILTCSIETDDVKWHPMFVALLARVGDGK